MELVSPLLLSHRRLLIGDHKQLPPFGTERMLRLLGSPANVKDALGSGQQLVHAALRQAGMEEVLGELEGTADFVSICGAAAAGLMMFETMVEEELGRQIDERQTTLPIARRLRHQHRMHPAICRLVSDVFYEGTLVTHGECERRFRENPTPFDIVDEDCLPTSPIVFVDMPYVQRAHGRMVIEQPWFHNPDEVEATVRVLSFLRAPNVTGGGPSLAVLTPYRDQAVKLESRIRREVAEGRLPFLEGFRTRMMSRRQLSLDLWVRWIRFRVTRLMLFLCHSFATTHHSGARAIGVSE